MTIVLPRAALGGLASWSGLKIYANTWDYDGRYRSLVTDPARHAFSGGDGARDPLVMDDTSVIVLP